MTIGYVIITFIAGLVLGYTYGITDKRWKFKIGGDK